MDIGHRIQELRKLSGMTTKELSEQIAVSPSFVSAIENNTTKLSLKTLTHICKVLGVALSEFFNSKLSPVEQKLITQIRHLPEE
ncbi:helix-turn-helix domain-containing protein [Desemzia sp. FAM 23991]|uniref:helix-turn-helix domain-containing protein n=1 Tax=unclassified Desemzia TaxID=2685243 RepID=UPI0038852C35